MVNLIGIIGILILFIMCSALCVIAMSIAWDSIKNMIYGIDECFFKKVPKRLLKNGTKTCVYSVSETGFRHRVECYIISSKINNEIIYYEVYNIKNGTSYWAIEYEVGNSGCCEFPDNHENK